MLSCLYAFHVIACVKLFAAFITRDGNFSTSSLWREGQKSAQNSLPWNEPITYTIYFLQFPDNEDCQKNLWDKQVCGGTWESNILCSDEFGKETGLQVGFRRNALYENPLFFCLFFTYVVNKDSGPEVIKLVSCSILLSIRFTQLINIKMPKIVDICYLSAG